MIDLQDGMKAIKDHMKWFQSHPPIQRTWGKLISILLVLGSDNPVDREKVREYQRTHLGRSDSNHCLLELMPLPSCSTKEQDWRYGQFGINYLSSRDSYLEHVLPQRISALKKLIEEHCPNRVIFYSMGYMSAWQTVAGGEFSTFTEDRRVFHLHSGEADYFVIPHPVAHGMSNQDWLDIGYIIKESAPSSD